MVKRVTQIVLLFEALLDNFQAQFFYCFNILIFKSSFDKEEGATTFRMSMNHDIRNVRSGHTVDEACN